MEKDIHHIFDSAREILSKQKTKLTNDIIQWGERAIHQIQNEIDDQVARLDQEHADRIGLLAKEREDFVTSASVYKSMNDRTSIGQLLEQCRTLKFHLGSLERYEWHCELKRLKSDEGEPMDYQSEEPHPRRYAF